MKIKSRFESVSQPVVYREGGGRQGAVGLIGGQGTLGSRAGKKQRNIFDTSDTGVVDDGVIVVKMKGVMKMIGIGNQKQKKS